LIADMGPRPIPRFFFFSREKKKKQKEERPGRARCLALPGAGQARFFSGGLVSPGNFFWGNKDLPSLSILSDHPMTRDLKEKAVLFSLPFFF